MNLWHVSADNATRYSCLRLDFVGATTIISIPNVARIHIIISCPITFISHYTQPRVYKYTVLFVPRTAPVYYGGMRWDKLYKTLSREGRIAFHLVPLYKLCVTQLSYLPHVSCVPSSIWAAHCLRIPNMQWNSGASYLVIRGPDCTPVPRLRHAYLYNARSIFHSFDLRN